MSIAKISLKFVVYGSSCDGRTIQTVRIVFKECFVNNGFDFGIFVAWYDNGYRTTKAKKQGFEQPLPAKLLFEHIAKINVLAAIPGFGTDINVAIDIVDARQEIGLQP